VIPKIPFILIKGIFVFMDFQLSRQIPKNWTGSWKKTHSNKTHCILKLSDKKFVLYNYVIHGNTQREEKLQISVYINTFPPYD